ncbi:MAG TPA: response regulator [Micromonosporaceae bacterium]|nr:response regulator [Micromonosporaceae bacterium]
MTGTGPEAFRALFAEEAEARLGRLGTLLLQLEESTGGTPAELAAIGEIFREVHTIKGAAAMVGFAGVGAYAHIFEEHLDALRSTRTASTPQIIDALLVASDGLKALTWQAVEGDDEAGAVDDHPAIRQLVSAFAAEPGAPPEPPAMPAPVPVEGRPDEAPPSAPVVAAPAPPRREASSMIMVPMERLDELVRLVGEAAGAHLRIGRVLSERLGIGPTGMPEFSELSRLLNQLQELAMHTRMVPIANITDQLHRALRDAARTLGKDVKWEVRGGNTELDRSVLHQLSDALLHLVRNAVDHGIDSPAERAAAGKPAQATVRLHAMQLGSEVTIVVTDDGRGIDLDRVRRKAGHLGIAADAMNDDDALQLIFQSGLSTTSFVSDISGRGVGLDVVRASVDAARGRIEVHSQPGLGCEFRVVVPVTLAVWRCLMVAVAGQRFAMPMHQVVLARAGNADQEVAAEGRRALVLDGQSVPISDVAEVLGLPAGPGPGMLVVVNGAAGRHALRVDQLIGQRDVAVKSLSPLVRRPDVIAGASVEPDGSILLMLDLAGLIERARQLQPMPVVGATTVVEPSAHSGRVLVVDDALTVRELQRSILERAGFEVVVAGDGVEALSRLGEQVPDLVLTDVEMPRMDGFALTEQIRARPTLANVAVLILTSLSSDIDRQRGLDAGADGYIVKSAFDEQSLLSAVDRVLGARS